MPDFIDNSFPSESRPSPDVELVKLELGDDVKRLAETIDVLGFDSKSASYSFTEMAKLDSLLLPADIASFVIAQDSEVKSVNVSFESELAQPRPRNAIEIALVNGERIVTHRDPADLRTPNYSVIYSTAPDDIHMITPSEISYFLSSLVVPRNRRPDLDIAALLSNLGPQSAVDPTDPVISHYLTQLLEMHADSWVSQEFSTVDIEDDRTQLTITKDADSLGMQSFSANLRKNGSDMSSDDSFDATAKLVLFPGESTHQADLSYERYWDNGTRQIGSGDDAVHVIDYMRAAIETCKRTLDSLPDTESYEQLAAIAIERECLRRRAPDERTE